MYDSSRSKKRCNYTVYLISIVSKFSVTDRIKLKSLLLIVFLIKIIFNFLIIYCCLLLVYSPFVWYRVLNKIVYPKSLSHFRIVISFLQLSYKQKNIKPIDVFSKFLINVQVKPAFYSKCDVVYKLINIPSNVRCSNLRQYSS